MVNPKHDKKNDIRTTKNLEKIEWYMPSPFFYSDHHLTIQRKDIIFSQLGNSNTYHNVNAMIKTSLHQLYVINIKVLFITNKM